MRVKKTMPFFLEGKSVPEYIIIRAYGNIAYVPDKLFIEHFTDIHVRRKFL